MTPCELNPEVSKKWVGIYSFNDDTIANIISYCCEKVWDYVCDNSTINWQMIANNDELSEFQKEVLQRAYKRECESYLALGGDYKDTPKVANNTITNVNAEDITLSPQTIKVLCAGGFLYRGLR